jgi:hypothetical protein
MRALYLLIGCLMMLFVRDSYADDIKIDIYKTNQFTLANIQPIVDASKAKIKIAHEDYVKGRNMEAAGRILSAFQDKVKSAVGRMGDFAYLRADFIFYPNDPNDYLTINVVDKRDAASMPVYDPVPTGHYQDPAHLIRDWKRYQDVAMRLYMTHKYVSTTENCKEFHCLGPFVTPTLKKYEQEFNREVPKHQNELVAILKNDADASNRATAAFLLAHTTNEENLIQWMLGSINDSNEMVRNNTIRVLSVMAMKNEHITLPVDDFIKMLHSPVLIDRNKGLAVLFGLSQQPRYVEIIKEKAGSDLMDSLRMNQPNLHNSAYLTLQSISGQLKNKSGQHYSDRDYAAWSHWLGLS